MSIERKRGPHNTWRYYDTSDGKYCKVSFLGLDNYTKSSKTYENKERIRRKQEQLYFTAHNSRDKYLYDVYQFLNNKTPGCIISVNKFIKDPVSGLLRELDIETKKYLVEVKSGSVEHCEKQFYAQKIYCKKKNKKHIVFAPNISQHRKWVYEQHGFTIITKLEDLKEVE